MIFQDPLSSLNPVLTIGRQITEALETHKGMSAKRPSKRAIELLELVGIPSAAATRQRLSAPVQRRHAPARDDRDGAQLRAEPAHRGRADDRARRHDPGPDPGAAPPPPDRARDGRPAHHPRPRAWWPGFADRLAVMYAGRARRARARPRRSSPTRPTPTPSACCARCRAWTGRARRALTPIEGSPPDLASRPRGLPVRATLRLAARPAAGPTHPPLELAGGERLRGRRRSRGHEVACHNQPTRDEADRRPAADAPASSRPPPPAAVVEALVEAARRRRRARIERRR